MLLFKDEASILVAVCVLLGRAVIECGRHNFTFMLHTFLVVIVKMVKIGVYLPKLSQTSNRGSAFWNTVCLCSYAVVVILRITKTAIL